MMKNGTKALSGIVITVVLALCACNNFFHDLIPPDDTLILSFQIEGQLGAADISSGSVNVTVERGAAVNALVPVVRVSERATLLPVTWGYVKAAFPSADIFETTMKIGASSDIVSSVTALIKENPDFTVPALDIPIDFSGPVTMIVVGGGGSMRQYTVKVAVDSGEPRLLNIRFSKYDNAELITDALCVINGQSGTVTANAVYPAEMDYLSYALVPTFEILGETLEIDGEPVISGVDAVQFNRTPGIQNKTVTVTRDGETKNYDLAVTFTEDPDSIRSITDFRFERADNAGIAANAVASIINTDNTGTITAQVFYQGAKPPALTPRFISPGTVSAGGVTQASGASSRDFTSPVQYRVVSRDGMYTRTYTVKVEYISLTDSAPRITSFGFSAALNAELAQDADGQISGELILIDARYGGAYPPNTLIPEFSAEGLVTVFGSVQISGSSGQDFFSQIKYTVTNPLNPLLTRDYWAQCRFVRDTSLDAAITSFGFYPEDNDGLADAVIGKIDKITSRITVYAPIGSGATTRTMIPRFTAAGQVNVEGSPQVSGQSGRAFDAPVTYTVVSANGLNSRNYTVEVRELMSTMYVDQNAVGSGDGTSWANAFRYLQTACEAAAQFPEDAPKEIWIAAGTYKPKDIDDYFALAANTSYVGGFAGHETAKSQRNAAVNEVAISGDLGGGLYAKHLFAAAGKLGGDLSFENLRLTGVKGQQGAGIYALLDNASEMAITDCGFDYMEASGAGGSIFVSGGSAVIARSAFYACTNGAVYVRGTSARISDVEFSTCVNGNVVRLDCTGETEITRVNASYTYGTVFYLGGSGNKILETVAVNGVGQCLEVQNTTGDVRVNNLAMRDIGGAGITLNGVNGVKRLSGVTGVNIGGSAINSTASSGSFTLTGGAGGENNTFDNIGIISITNASGTVSVLNTEIKNSRGSSTLRVSAVNAVIDALSITESNYFTYDGYHSGSVFWDLAEESAALDLTCSGQASVSNTTIDTVKYSGYYRDVFYEEPAMGVRIRGGGSFSFVNSVIKNVSMGIYSYSTAAVGWPSNLEINGLVLKDIVDYGIYSSGGAAGTVRNIKASNITASNVGYYSVYISAGSVKHGIIIKDSTFENTAGLYFSGNYSSSTNDSDYEVDSSDSSVELSNISMNNINISNTSYTAAIQAQVRSVIMDRVNITNVYNRSSQTQNGGYTGTSRKGINIHYANTVRISNSNIKNCENTRWTGSSYSSPQPPVENRIGAYGWEGAGIFIQCKGGTAEISNTTIEDAEACLGGAIYYCYTAREPNYNIGSGADSLTLRGVTIKNAKASYQPVYSNYNTCGVGGGVYFYSNGKLNIINTTMENCQSETNYGAVYTLSSGNTITGSTFKGCTSAGSFKVLDASKFNAGGYTITP